MVKSMFVVEFGDPSREYSAALLRQVIASDNSICFCFSKPPPRVKPSFPATETNPILFFLLGRFRSAIPQSRQLLSLTLN
ncbi:hypothetical protein TNCV_1162601 [Trichonephila clavipes]|nr:hypothetical protein TNCV_1162601 [Trichonephila clavipes]